MSLSLSESALAAENQQYQDCTGVSQNNRHLGFLPAFYDTETGQSYLSRFADGKPASIHVLDGLPEKLIVSRTENGQVKSVKASVISGFLYAGIFYTRDEVATLM